MRPSNEPLFWSLFSAGGMVTALLVPALIVVTGFVVPAEGLDFADLDGLFGHVLLRGVIFGIAFLTFFHFAHRFRHTVHDLGFRRANRGVMAISYVAAIAGTVWAAVVVL